MNLKLQVAALTFVAIALAAVDCVLFYHIFVDKRPPKELHFVEEPRLYRVQIPWIQTGDPNGPVMVLSNVLDVTFDHEHSTPPCALIRYLSHGETNEFHAWATTVKIMDQ